MTSCFNKTDNSYKANNKVNKSPVSPVLIYKLYQQQNESDFFHKLITVT